MGPIVCATRGGEAGRRTQQQAIALAIERSADLVFLCVSDPKFAGEQSEALAAAVKAEQRWLGRALLGTARARARAQGVYADTVVLSGPVLETIEAYLREAGASTLVIGKPRVDSPLAVFHPSSVNHFAGQVREDTGVEVVVVTPEKESRS
jgi:hypothetical protein